MLGIEEELLGIGGNFFDEVQLTATSLTPSLPHSFTSSITLHFNDFTSASHCASPPHPNSGYVSFCAPSYQGPPLRWPLFAAAGEDVAWDGMVYEYTSHLPRQK